MGVQGFPLLHTETPFSSGVNVSQKGWCVRKAGQFPGGEEVRTEMAGGGL